MIRVLTYIDGCSTLQEMSSSSWVVPCCVLVKYVPQTPKFGWLLAVTIGLLYNAPSVPSKYNCASVMARWKSCGVEISEDPQRKWTPGTIQTPERGRKSRWSALWSHRTHWQGTSYLRGSWRYIGSTWDMKLEKVPLLRVLLERSESIENMQDMEGDNQPIWNKISI